MSDENNKYMYSTEELDSIIDQIERGITPMMNDQLALEIKLRYKELNDELFDDDEDDVDIIRHREAMQKHIEQKKREATKEDVIIFKLTDNQISQIRDDMAVSIVRPNPDSVYNMPDEVLYNSKERKEIQQKLSRIRNCYYNQTDYVNAFNIIREAIMFSLEHDYPWLTKEEAIRQFNEGKIKFTYCNIPKLYINYQTQITDPAILKGVVTGDVTLVNRNDDEPVTKRRNKDYTPIQCDYDVVGDSEYQQMVALHSQGYDTPISHHIKAKSSIYNRFTLPSSNRFSRTFNNGYNNNNTPIVFDWTKENAGREYFERIHGKEYTINDILRDVNKMNNGELNQVMQTKAVEFFKNLKKADNPNMYDDGYTRPDNVTSSLQVNPEVIRVEQNILEAIRANNPVK